MAAIRETIELVDQFSPVIKDIVGSVNYAVTAMEQMAQAMNFQIDGSALESARAQTDRLNASMRLLSGAADDVGKQVDTFNDDVKKFSGTASETESGINKLNDTMKQAAGEAAEIKSDIIKLDDTMKQVSGDTIKTEAEINKLGNAMKQVSGSTDELGKSTDGAEKEIAQLQNRLNAAEREAAQFQNSLNSAEKEITELQNRLNSAEKEITQLKEKMAGLDDEVGNMGGEFGNVTSSINDLFIALGGYKILGFVKSAFSETTSAAMDFESAITGVYKTVDGSAEQLAGLSDAVKQMAIEIPSTTTEIAGVMESAGQLGIDTGDIESFSRTMIDLANSTNLTSEAAATSLAKFANITGMSADKYENLSSAIVDLGNNFATTEADIVDMSSYLSSAATLAGFAETDILALSTAMSSVGISAEAGGSSMSRLITEMQTAVETGNDLLTDFASVSGMTVEQFSDLFENRAVDALSVFIGGLNDVERNGASASVILQQMELDDIRLSNTIKALASSSGVMSTAIQTANQAWEENTALTNEVSKRYSTLESKLTTTKNAANNFKIAIGSSLNPILSDLSEAATGALTGLTDLAEASPAVTAGLAGFAGTAVTAVSAIATVAPAISQVIMAYKSLDKAISLSKIGIAIGVVSAVVGVGAAIYTSFKNAEDSVEDYNGTLEQCRNEIDETQAKYDAVVAAYGAQDAAAKELSGQLDTLNAQYEKGGGAAADYAQRVEEGAKVLNDYKNNWQEQIDEINNTQAAGQILVAQLEALSNKSLITSNDLDLMQSIAEELNSDSDYHMNVTVDYETGEVSGLDKQWFINQANQSKIEAAEKAMTDGESIVAYQKAYMERKEALARMQYAEDQMKKIASDPSYVYVENKETSTKVKTIGDDNTSDSYKPETRSYSQLEEDYETFQNAVNEAQASMEEFENTYRDSALIRGFSLEESNQWLDEMRNGFENAANSAENFNEAIAPEENLAKVWDSCKEDIQEFALAYDEAYEEIRGSLEGMFGVFDEAKMNLENTLSFKDATSNIESQIKYFEQYEEALNKLSGYGLDNKLLSQLDPEQIVSFSNELEGMDSEAAAEKVNKLSESFGKLSEAKDKTAEALMGVNDEVQQKLNDLQQKIETAVGDMELNDEAKKAAESTMGSYITELVESGDIAIKKAKHIANGISQALASVIIPDFNITLPDVSVSTSGSGSLPGHAKGTTNAEDIFIAGEEGPELIVGKQGSTVFPTSETNRILSAMSGFDSSNEYAANPLESKIINNYNSLQSSFDDSNIVSSLNDINEKISKFNSGLLTSDVIVDLSFLDDIVSKFKADNINYNDYSRNYDESFTSVSQGLNSDDEPYGSIYPVENNQYTETVSRKEIIIKFDGGGEIVIPKNNGVSKNEILELLFRYAKPVLADILSAEILEEGDSSYDY